MTDQTDRGLDRRAFVGGGIAVGTAFALPAVAAGDDARPVRLGLIADLHQDIMHDGPQRLGAFVAAMREAKPDALVQLGDFAYPNDANQPLVDSLAAFDAPSLHVIGNHDTDAGYTKPQCVERWGIPARYYRRDVGSLRLLVLDGNDKGSPTHGGGYASYVGPEQVEWLKAELAGADRPVVVLSHQPLAGPGSVDNAEDLQALLAEHAGKVLLSVNGHTHIDNLLRVGGVPYLHVNSASYYWVGGNHRHESYPAEVHQEHKWISSTCPYRDPLFTLLTIDPSAGVATMTGRESVWVGQSPQELGVAARNGLAHGQQITPGVREREIRL